MPLKELSKEEQSQLFIQGRGPKTKAVQLTRKDLGSYICIYSRDHKFVVFCFALLLLQILDNFQNQCQSWNLLVWTISKHLLHVQFDQVLAETLEVKDT